MTQAYNLSQLANNLNSAGQLDASDGLVNAVPIANGGTNASSASGARSNLGLGTMATQNSNSVSITGGTITGITDLAVADGGTGTSAISGVVFGNGGASPMSAATGPQIAAAIDTTYVANATFATTAGSANSVSSAVVAQALVGLDPYTIGTYAWGLASGISAAGQTTSSFYPMNSQTNASPSFGNVTPTSCAAGAVGGTWKMMSFASTSNTYQVGLFLRIS